MRRYILNLQCLFLNIFDDSSKVYNFYKFCYGHWEVININCYFSPKWLIFSISMGWSVSMGFILFYLLVVNVVGKADDVGCFMALILWEVNQCSPFSTNYLSTEMFCMLMCMETGKTEILIQITFLFIPFCRQPFKYDKRFNVTSRYMHRYPRFPSP